MIEYPEFKSKETPQVIWSASLSGKLLWINLQL